MSSRRFNLSHAKTDILFPSPQAGAEAGHQKTCGSHFDLAAVEGGILRLASCQDDQRIRRRGILAQSVDPVTTTSLAGRRR